MSEKFVNAKTEFRELLKETKAITFKWVNWHVCVWEREREYFFALLKEDQIQSCVLPAFRFVVVLYLSIGPCWILLFLFTSDYVAVQCHGITLYLWDIIIIHISSHNEVLWWSSADVPVHFVLK